MSTPLSEEYLQQVELEELHQSRYDRGLLLAEIRRLQKVAISMVGETHRLQDVAVVERTEYRKNLDAVGNRGIALCAELMNLQSEMNLLEENRATLVARLKAMQAQSLERERKALTYGYLRAVNNEYGDITENHIDDEVKLVFDDYLAERAK